MSEAACHHFGRVFFISAEFLFACEAEQCLGEPLLKISDAIVFNLHH
jgi:hypothetical protein